MNPICRQNTRESVAIRVKHKKQGGKRLQNIKYNNWRVYKFLYGKFGMEISKIKIKMRDNRLLNN